MHDAAPRLVPNRRDVAHEGFEGEVILIHFPTGKYFRLDESGKVAWSAVERGATRDDVAAALRRTFEVGERESLASAQTFLESLAAHGLVVPGEAPPPGLPGAPPAAEPSSRPRGAFREPTIESFSDLQELFLVDPIHDVDETGWPHAKP
jgi:hypothetical protein